VIGACKIYGNSRCRRNRQRGSDGTSHIKLKRYGKRWRTVERDRRRGSIAGEPAKEVNTLSLTAS